MPNTPPTTFPVIVLYLAGLVLLALVAYWPGLHGGFLFDDFGNIVNNPSIRIGQLSLDSLTASLAGPDAGPLGRPISVLSFALTHYFFGLDPFAFKAVNLAIHALNAMLVGWLATLLLARFGGPSRPTGTIRWLTIWITAAWLLHPINAVPVLLSVQRMTLLSGTFVLLATIGHLKAMAAPPSEHRVGWLAAAWLVFWPLAIFSKETGLIFPLFAILISLTPAPTGPAARRASRWPITLAAGLLLAALAAMLWHIGWNWLERGYAMRSFTLTERLLTEARVLWFYAQQIVLPSHTSFGVYLDDFVLSRSLLEPAATLPALLGLLAVAAALPFLWRRWPVPAFGMAWFLAGHTLESTVLPLEIAHEYRNYIPSIGLILALGWQASSWLAGLRLDHRRLTVSLAALLPVAVLAIFTWMRAGQWSDPLLGSQLEAIHHPDSARANYTAAQILFSTGHGDADDPIGAQMVRYHFQKAADIDPNQKLPHLGLISWSCASRRPLEAGWANELGKRLEQTPYSPKDRELPGNLLKIILNQPTCLDRRTVVDLFTAGSRNPNIDRYLRAAFLDAAADYELLVSKDIVSAKSLLDGAHALIPGNRAMNKKLKSFEQVLSDSAKQGR